MPVEGQWFLSCNGLPSILLHGGIEVFIIPGHFHVSFYTEGSVLFGIHGFNTALPIGRQYVGQDVPGVKVFDLKLLARCVAACFLQGPDLVFRYPRKFFSDPTISSLAFSPENREIIYYASCLLYYRVAILFSNRALTPEAKSSVKIKIVPTYQLPPIFPKTCENQISISHQNSSICHRKFNQKDTLQILLGTIWSQNAKKPISDETGFFITY